MTTIEIILTVALVVIAIADLLTHQRADARLNDAERDIAKLDAVGLKLTVDLDKLAARIPPVKARKPRSESGPIKRSDAPIPFVPTNPNAPFVVDLSTPLAEPARVSAPDRPASVAVGASSFRGTPKKPEGDGGGDAA